MLSLYVSSSHSNLSKRDTGDDLVTNDNSLSGSDLQKIEPDQGILDEAQTEHGKAALNSADSSLNADTATSDPTSDTVEAGITSTDTNASNSDTVGSTDSPSSGNTVGTSDTSSASTADSGNAADSSANADKDTSDPASDTNEANTTSTDTNTDPSGQGSS